MNFYFIFLLLILSSCTSTPSPSLPAPPYLEEQFSNELIFIENIEITSFKEELKKVLSQIKNINISSENCSTGQVACSFSSQPHTIFLKPIFYQLSKPEQFTTLLHEGHHLLTNRFDHVLCKKEINWGHECDEDFNSAYGIEYKYLLMKYQKERDAQLFFLLKRLDTRVNKS